MRSLAVTSAGSSPSTVTAIVFGLLWGSVWVARTCSTSLVPMPNASAPNAPWVAVWESPQTITSPGCVRPISGPMMWTMPCPRAPHGWSWMPNSSQLFLSLHLLRGDPVLYRQPHVGRRDVVVHGREREVRAPHPASREPEPFESLRARHLVHEVEVYVEEIRLPLGAAHHVPLPPSLRASWVYPSLSFPLRPQ